MIKLVKRHKNGLVDQEIELTAPTADAPGSSVQRVRQFGRDTLEVARTAIVKRQSQYDRYLAEALREGFVAESCE